MDERTKSVEIRLGLFILLGLAVVAVLVVQFGRVGRGFREYYHLKVEFPNASGLILGSDVQLAGAKIGDVDEAPKIAANSSSVVVGLRVFKGIRIPKKFRFQITSTGLLGDRFVEVLPRADFNPAQFDPTDPGQLFGDGDRIMGESGSGLSELTEKGGDVMEKLRAELDNIQKITTTLHKELLSPQNLKNVEATLANFKTASASFADSSKNIGAAAQNASQVMDKAKDTMTTVNSAAEDLRGAIGDARKTIDGAKALLRKASDGNGLLPALLSDKELAENFRSLIINLRRSGVLFYKDAAARAKDTPPPGGIRNR